MKNFSIIRQRPELEVEGDTENTQGRGREQMDSGEDGDALKKRSLDQASRGTELRAEHGDGYKNAARGIQHHKPSSFLLPGCDLVLKNNPFISNVHCTLKFTPEGVTITGTAKDSAPGHS